MAKEISEKTQSDAKALRKLLDIDTKTGLSTVNADWYDGQREAFGVDAAQLKLVRELDTHVANVAVLAVGEEANALGKKHKGLERVQVKVHGDGKNTFNVDWKRRIETMNPTTKEKGEKFGVANVKFDFYGTGTHGEMKLIREQIAEQGAASLAD